MNTLPDLNSKNCPVTHAVRIMGRRWKPLVLYYLGPGPLRFSELRRRIPEASQKMLTQTLRELEKDGLILRKSYPQVPPKVVYSTTRYGRTLEPILLALCAWGEKDFKRRLG
jgi:DNA-binding HxlR family transcriptional regulator